MRTAAPYHIRGKSFPDGTGIISALVRDDPFTVLVPIALGNERRVQEIINRHTWRKNLFNNYCSDLYLTGKNHVIAMHGGMSGAYYENTIYRAKQSLDRHDMEYIREDILETILFHEVGHHIWGQMTRRQKTAWVKTIATSRKAFRIFWGLLRDYSTLDSVEESFCSVISDYCSVGPDIAARADLYDAVRRTGITI